MKQQDLTINKLSLSDTSLPSLRTIRTLEQIIAERGRSSAMRFDNGPEYISQALIEWASNQQITLLYSAG